jgi:hypothetical protein
MRSNASVIPSESIQAPPTNSLFLKPKIVGGGGNTAVRPVCPDYSIEQLVYDFLGKVQEV